MECSICLEKKTEYVECFSCSVVTCVECTKTYLLTDPDEAHCSKCKTGWNIKFLVTNFPKTWVTGNAKSSYRTHRKEVMLETQKSQMHRTLAVVETKKEYYKAVEEKNKLLPIITDLRRKLREYKGKIKTYYRVISFYKKETVVSKVAFFCPCPVEMCKGMIKTKTKKCILCEVTVCTKCLDIKGWKKKLSNEKSDGVTWDSHQCDPESVETAKEILKSTKACPKCGTRIFKIDGCDQMWCTECNTPFSWRTGIIETGTIHNPHAVAWFKQNKDTRGQERLLRGVQCGGLMDLFVFIEGLSNLRTCVSDGGYYNSGCKDAGCGYCVCSKIHRSVAEAARLIRSQTPDEDKLDELREEYVLGIIDEKAWHRNIFLTERRHARKRANLRILETYQTLGIDQINSFHQAYKKNKSVGKRFPKQSGPN